MDDSIYQNISSLKDCEFKERICMDLHEGKKEKSQEIFGQKTKKEKKNTFFKNNISIDYIELNNLKQDNKNLVNFYADVINLFFF